MAGHMALFGTVRRLFWFLSEMQGATVSQVQVARSGTGS
jgi:hypothetical protein